ncbi:hypothetical protein ABF174_002209 [Flavobacterium psychrophilum]
MEKYNTEEILRESQENVKKLNDKLKDIESLHNEIKDSVSLSLKNPILFKELAEKLNGSAELYLTGNNKIFDQKISEISNKTSELGSEINRLIEVDFNTLFKDLEANFLENSKVEIGKELTKIDEKAANLQNKIDDLGKEITRLSKIDLEEHFNKHQSKLSEVFISVNGINGVLSTISQNINKIIQNFGDIEQIISKNQKEINKNLENIIENQEKKTKELLNKIMESDTKLVSLISQNETFKKELDFNKKLGFVIILLVIITIIVSLL